MNTPPTPRPPHDAQALRSMMRTDLVAAMKAREPETVSALRTAIAAIENAEAITAPAHTDGGASSEHVAGTRVGVGSTEVERRTLSAEEVRSLLRAQITDRVAEADRYDAHGRHEAADRLRREADTLGKYV
ncbi:GatB/YqeY domain-containing protein [Nocardiopsis lambiniae]|uniref:Glutamyl-tRNA amidotransferase n=1 Tax=Nocardiopsis lambiniae TaxID=3075539 RepID=A0ABU2MHY2_9ACTN|nr:hypothetical protein [Nocardiopsis sp. DSM 44743]MDT0331841.1 hypothetical protein [Nocardiopsis sp. DSM 44743]